ncbi:MAG: glucuronate isomerase [Clostridiales bacterium]|nr:MAG: glucuronate isomerase [Clostridiales bacterium]
MNPMKENDFLLSGPVAQRLYKAYGGLPILDFHCHLSPRAIYEDRTFLSIGELMLSGDHYKWRLMRACGVEEYYVTGDAPWSEKFKRYAACLEQAPGNPMVDWTRMELADYFGIETPLTPKTADEIWTEANRVIGAKALSPRKLIASSNVRYIATTDDPADDLTYHEKLRQQGMVHTVVRPTFRGDGLLSIRQEESTAYAGKLGVIAGVTIRSYKDYLEAVSKRLADFARMDCRLADVGIERFPLRQGSYEQADTAFQKGMAGLNVSDREYDAFLFETLVFLAGECRQRDITLQLHLGAVRNPNTFLYENLGSDCGGDCMGDPVPPQALCRLLDAINRRSGLPRIILYPLNPAAVEPLVSVAGSFPGVTVGPAWWFNDHLCGIERQLRVFSANLPLASYPGMVTDSRSFTSYIRHDYFRRIFASYIGQIVESGRFSEQAAMETVRRVYFGNAERIVNRL